MLNQIDPSRHGPFGQSMRDAVQTCVHCGFCLPACPTYRELGEEMDSPRGRIVLMKEVLEGTMALEDAGKHIDQCLGCLACETACPSGVPYRDLISPFRALHAERRQRSLGEKLRRVLIRNTLPYPGRFRLAAQAGRLAKSLSRLLPRSLSTMLALLPAALPARKNLPEIVPARGHRRARVALLSGCAQQVLDPDINDATIEVLTRSGVEVIIPRGQSCCGALSWHIGDLGQARMFARQNLRAFPADVDAIITNAAGCGSGLREYPLMLSGTPEAEEAARFGERALDVTVFLARLGDLAPIPDPGREIRIAYHDACHLSNGQGVREEPRILLRRIPGARILEIADAHLCCGSAGTYNIDQPAIAASLGAKKAANAIDTWPDLIATGNIGCLTQLNVHLAKLNNQIPVRHTMQILRDAYRGTLRPR